jgi:hypothetical protein
MLNSSSILLVQNEDRLGKARQPEGFLNRLGGLML